MSPTKRNLPVFDPGLCRCCGSVRKCRMLTAEYESQGQKEVYSDLLKGCFDLVVRIARGSKPPPSTLVAVTAVKEEPRDCSPEPSGTDQGADAEAAPDSRSTVSDDLPLTSLHTRAPPPRPRLRPARTDVKKSAKNLPMTRLQQMHRERDAAYLTETNTLSIVEHSYACPFKCRHNNYLCYYCGHLCRDPGELRAHTHAEHHPRMFRIYERKKLVKMDLTRVDCRLCDAKIDDLATLKKHLKSHEVEYYPDYPDAILPFRLTADELACALCDAKYPYFHALNKHMNVHFRNFVCETCGLGFVDKCRFVMHQLRHAEGEFPCQVCGKTFRAQYNRELHVDRVHNRRGRVYCPKCDVTLMSYAQKLKHLVEIHGEEPLSFPCSLCDKVCPTRRMLTIHKRKDHMKDYRYDCQYCGQKFFTNFALNNHLPMHTGERNFKCKVCEKTYPRLKTLKDHMRIHNNDRRYRCHVCGQAFIQNCSLKGHMKSQHPEYG